MDNYRAELSKGKEETPKTKVKETALIPVVEKKGAKPTPVQKEEKKQADDDDFWKAVEEDNENTTESKGGKLDQSKLQ